MASPSFAPQSLAARRVPLAEIDAVVAARLGPTRGLGNSQPACFNRQVAMFLAARVGRWSTTAIGRFYGGRDHSTVCYGIQRIESLSESDPEVDALLADLSRRLGDYYPDQPAEINKGAARVEGLNLSEVQVQKIAEIIAERICARLGADLSERLPRDFGGAHFK